MVLERVPFESHGSLRVVCKQLKIIVSSPEFRKWRVERGLAEYALLLAGGQWSVAPYQGRKAGDWHGVFAYCSMLTSGRWRSITPLMGLRHKACFAIVEDEDGQPEMWVMGGYDGTGSALATVEAYNPRTNTWRSCLSMKEKRSGAVAGVVGGRLVVAGGHDDVGPLTSVEAYTPTGWTPLPPLPHAHRNATASVLNGRLYVMSVTFCNKLQVLEMSEENVRTLDSQRRTARARRIELSWPHNAVRTEPFERRAGVDGKLWLIGCPFHNAPVIGRFVFEQWASRSVFIYDIETDKWETGPFLRFHWEFCGHDS